MWTCPPVCPLVRYGLEDSQSCLLVADLERLDRAPFLEQMRSSSKIVINYHCSVKKLIFLLFLFVAICSLDACKSLKQFSSDTNICPAHEGIPAICMRAGARQPPQSAQRFETLVSLGKSLDPIPRQPVDKDVLWRNVVCPGSVESNMQLYR